jgi:hypothetical protein
MASQSNRLQLIEQTLLDTVARRALREFARRIAFLDENEVVIGQWTFTLPTLFANGSAAAPSVAASSDPDTGWFWVNPNTLRASTGAVEAIIIDASQNVGIGTSSTSDRLHVRKDVAGNTRFVVHNQDQKTFVGSRYVFGVEQYSYVQATNSAETSNTDLFFQPSGGTVRVGGIGGPEIARFNGSNGAFAKKNGATTTWTIRDQNTTDLSVASEGSCVVLAAGTHTITTNTTWSARTIRVEQGALISVNTGVTLTINANVEAGLYPIFTGLGTVLLGKDVGTIYPEWWGAVPDNSTLCTTAIQSALNAGVITTAAGFRFGRKVKLSRGVYRCGPVAAEAPITIVGDGVMDSAIMCTSASGWVTISQSQEGDVAELSSFSITTEVANTNAPIVFTGVVLSSSNWPSIRCRNIHIYSAASEYFNSGWSFTNAWHWLLDEGCFFRGSTTVANWATNGALVLGSKCIDGRANDFWVYGADYGVNVNANNCEGVRITNSSLVAVTKGVYFNFPSAAPPHYEISSTHIAASDACIELRGTSAPIISNNLLYLGDQATQTSPAGAACIVLENVNGATIHGGNFIEKRTTSIGGSRYGIDLINSSLFHIGGNYFNDWTIGIRVGATCSNAGIEPNRFFNTTTPVSCTVASIGYENYDSGGQLIDARQRSHALVSAYRNSDVSNVTGDGTGYTIVFDSEQTDPDGRYDPSTGNFTAQYTGWYHVKGQVTIGNVGAGHTRAELNVIIGSFNHKFFCNPANMREATNNFCSIPIDQVFQMTAGQTASIGITVWNSTKTVSVKGASTEGWTFMSVFLA